MVEPGGSAKKAVPGPASGTVLFDIISRALHRTAPVRLARRCPGTAGVAKLRADPDEFRLVPIQTAPVSWSRVPRP